MKTIDERIEALKSVDVEVYPKHDYVADAPPLERVEVPNSVRAVRFHFTAEEWCEMCMREGSEYIGPCCGNTGAAQDEMSAIFRDNGFCEADQLLTIGVNLRDHDGWEHVAEKYSDENLEKWISNFPRYDTWSRVIVTFSILEEALEASWQDAPKEVDLNNEKHVVRALASVTSRLDWADLFHNDNVHAPPTAELLKARTYPLTKRLTELLEEHFVGLDGYALVRNGEVVTSRLGLMIFKEKEDAEYWLDVYKRSESGNLGNFEDMEISTVSVSREGQIKLGELV